MMAPYADEIATHEFEKLEPIGRVTLRPRKVNWKNVGDNYSDALHIPVAHPGLTRLFGATYRVESREWVDRMSGDLSDKPSRNWAERMYQKHLPAAEHLPRTSAAPGCTSSCGPTSRSTSTRTRSTSCSGCRSRRRRR